MGEEDAISFKTIENVGRGPALFVWVECTLATRTARIPILVPDKPHTIDCEIALPRDLGGPGEGVERYVYVKIHCVDTRGGSRTTTYVLASVDGATWPVREHPLVAPDVYLVSRNSRYTSAWRSRLRERLRVHWENARAYGFLIKMRLKSLRSKMRRDRRSGPPMTSN